MSQEAKHSNEQWAWYSEDGYSRGPYGSREAAIASAQDWLDEQFELGDEITFYVGRCIWAEPERWVVQDAEEVVDNMDDMALGDEFRFWEDSIFSIPKEKVAEATRELAEFMRAWAAKHVVAAKVWQLDDDNEQVRLIASPAHEEIAS